MLKLLSTGVKKRSLLLLTAGLLFSYGATYSNYSRPGGEALVAGSVYSSMTGVYNRLGIGSKGLKSEIFFKALQGWNYLKSKGQLPKSGLLTIVDLSKSSSSKRMYVIDMVHNKVLFHNLVAHGRNSGEEFARAFSNEPESYKSSLGFYITGDTYSGKHGLSLRLKGLERGINDLAEQRAIVIHGADYVSETFVKQHGRLGRSHGCPAVPVELSKPIIEQLKGGSCIFIYHPDPTYVKHSSLI